MTGITKWRSKYLFYFCGMRDDVWVKGMLLHLVSVVDVAILLGSALKYFISVLLLEISLALRKLDSW
jgi:hypothetical protein